MGPKNHYFVHPTCYQLDNITRYGPNMIAQVAHDNKLDRKSISISKPILHMKIFMLQKWISAELIIDRFNS